MLRAIARRYRAPASPLLFTSQSSYSSASLREAQGRISAPGPSWQSSNSVTMAHPHDPGPSQRTNEQSAPAEASAQSDGQTSSYSTSASVSLPPPPEEPSESSAPSEVVTGPPVRAPPPQPLAQPIYPHPPFNTHQFVKALEKTFPTPAARGLMRATRALLMNRVDRVKREGLAVKDLENQAYLFKAALSEMRAETTMRMRNESTKIQASNAALRREVDRLDVRIKESIANLKHEIQMEVDSRKHDARSDLKQQDIIIEEMHRKHLVALGELRSSQEEIRWDNMRRSVVTLSAFVIVILAVMELRPRPKKPGEQPRTVLETPPVPEAEGLEKMKWVT